MLRWVSCRTWAGSYLLARAPGRVGAYLGLTGARMTPCCAIWAGFADYFVPRAEWGDLVSGLVALGDPDVIRAHATPDSPLAAQAAAIDALFASDDGPTILTALDGAGVDLRPRLGP